MSRERGGCASGRGETAKIGVRGPEPMYYAALERTRQNVNNRVSATWWYGMKTESPKARGKFSNIPPGEVVNINTGGEMFQRGVFYAAAAGFT